MDIFALSAIAFASAVNSALPGPCVAMTVFRSARDGYSAGALVTLGVIAANLIICCVALSIMHGVLTLSPSSYVAMKWVGIVTLVFLAFRMLCNSKDRGNKVAPGARGGCRDLSTGLVVGLSSPFNLVFLLALLPQLVSVDGQTAFSILLITLAVLIGAAVSMGGIVLIGTVSADLLRGAGHQIERLGALLMIGFAILAGTTPNFSIIP